MKKLLLFFIANILFIYIQGQETQFASIKVGSAGKCDKLQLKPEYLQLMLLRRDIDDFQNNKIISLRNNNLYIINNNPVKNSLEDAVKLNFPENTKYSKTFRIDENKRIAFYIEDSKKDIKVLYQIIDLTKSKFISDPTILHDFEKGINAQMVRIVVDSGNILVTCQLKDSNEYVLFDKDFNKIYDSKIERISNENIEYSEILLQGKKRIEVIGLKKDIKGKDIELKLINDKPLKVLIYNENAELERELQVENDKNFFINRFNFIKAQDNTLKFITTYSNGKKGLVQGFANFSIDINSNINPKIQYNEIDEKIMCMYADGKNEFESILSSYKTKKNNTDFNYSSANMKIVPYESGYYVIIWPWNLETIGINGQSTLTHFRDFIVASYDNNDNLKWIKKAPGRYTQFQNFSLSCEFVVKNGELILVHPWSETVFYADPENQWNVNDLKKEKTDKKIKYLVLQKLDKNGKLSREKLYELDNLEQEFEFMVVYPPIEDSMLFLFYEASVMMMDKSYQLIRVDIK